MSKSSVSTSSSLPPFLAMFVPKLFVVLREGYDASAFRKDALAGLTVAIVALPLAMALGIASGATPDKGLITAVIAGFLISLLGGSRHQIGGPTGAFVVVIYDVILRHGYDGLLLATLMAGVMLILAGFFRLGTWIKYIPQPVIIGFTAGIALIIMGSQIKDFFGLQVEHVPSDFIEKVSVLWQVRGSVSAATVGLGGACLLGIVALRRFFPKVPAFLVAVVLASAVSAMAGLPVETIGSRFGGIPAALPWPQLPEVSFARMVELFPSAFTIFFLAGVESLLSAVVADGMTGRRHKSNCELVGQGVANIASSFFGGMPATGAIARTATSIRAGAVSPVAGMLHAVFVLLFMLLLAPLAAYVPLTALAAILFVVAWNMSEIERIRHLLKAPPGDVAVLFLTLLLTVLVDLTVAVEVGVVLGAILFVHRMANAVEIETDLSLIEKDLDEGAKSRVERPVAVLPEGVEAFQIQGPFFFGVAARLKDVIDQIGKKPKVFILRMGLAPFLDSTAAAALGEVIDRCHRGGTAVILSRVQPQPLRMMKQMGIAGGGKVMFAQDFADALKMAEKILR